MNKEIKFSPRRFGKLSRQLLEFYGWCKQKKSIVFAMPEGNIYSQKAHDNILKAQKADIRKKIEGLKKEEEIDCNCEPEPNCYCDCESKAESYNQALQNIIDILK